MEKIRAIALEEDKAKVVAALHNMNIIELRKSRLDINDDRPAPYSTEISDLLIKVNGALQILPRHEVKPERQMRLEAMLKEVKGMKALEEIYALSNERKGLEEDLAALGNAERIALAFKHIRVDFGRIRSERISYKAFEGGEKALRQLMKKLKDQEGMEVLVGRHEKKVFVFMAYDKRVEIEPMTKDAGFSEIDLTARYLDGYPSEILRKVAERRASDESRLHAIDSRLKALGARNYSHLSNLSEMLQIELERADAGAMFKKTEKAFVVEGWIEKRRMADLAEEMRKTTKGRVQIEVLEHDELAPTQTNRPALLKPFEYLLNFYSTQRSDEVDPTWIFVLSFPIFYGLMVSDVGYGLLSLIFVTYVSKIVSKDGLVYNAAKIWQMMSISAIFFGVLSNQYLGFQLNKYILPGFNGFDWLKDATAIIGITIVFGIIQIVIGLMFGFVNHWKRGHRLMAVSKLTSITAILFGTVAVSSLFGIMSGALPLYSAGIAVASIIATAAMSGHEATETINLITHPLSYARIMGFGLGSVIIALLIDTYFTPHLGHGAVGILVFIVYMVIFALLHFLNMILGIFEGIVQGVRLNFVEFFSKFYIGNGIRFKPFGYKRFYTKEEKILVK
ncbi:MAG: V-type ATPase 116kDa subunit family protein [Candidatus Micrarchaeaceae archaeon]